MTDTPEHIKKLQLDIWLSKSPAERLRQFLMDNEKLFQFWEHAKKDKTITDIIGSSVEQLNSEMK